MARMATNSHVALLRRDGLLKAGCVSEEIDVVVVGTGLVDRGAAAAGAGRAEGCQGAAAGAGGEP